MLAIIILIGSWVASFYLLKKVACLTIIERVAGCVAIGTSATTWVGFLLFLVLGLNAAAYTTAALMLTSGLYAAYKLRPERLPTLSTVRSVPPSILLSLFVVILLASLFFTHMLQQRPDGLYSGGYAWGDVAFHLSIANNFLHGPATLTYNIFTGAPLGYPFLGDFLTALLAAAGEGLPFVLFFTGASLAVSIVLLFYGVALRLLNNRAAASLALGLLLLNGGLGFVYLGSDYFLGNPLSSALQVTERIDYNTMFFHNLYWTNFVTSMFLPMRTALFGIALFFTVFLLLDNARRHGNDRTVLLAGILAGSMPLLHTHSFFVAVGIAVFMLWNDRKKLGAFLAPTLAFAAPQLLWSSQQVFSGTGFLRIQVGWMSHASTMESWFWFWIANASIAIPLAIVAWVKANDTVRRDYLPWACLFVIGNIIVFQPFEYDNIKFFFFWYAFTCILIAGFLSGVWNKSYANKALVVAAVVLLTCSGALSVVRESTQSWRLYDNEELALGTWVTENTPKDAVFLNSGRHNNFAASLAGRNIVMGPEFWLWTHGFNASQRGEDVSLMYAGGPTALELLAKYNVTYVVIGPYERGRLYVDTVFFEEHFELVKHTENYSIYKIDRVSAVSA